MRSVDEETKAQELSHLPRVIQLVRGFELGSLDFSLLYSLSSSVFACGRETAQKVLVLVELVRL